MSPTLQMPNALTRLMRRSTLKFIASRLSQAVIVMFLVVVANFTVMQMAPGDMVDVLSGTQDMSAEQIKEMRERYGLDQPGIVQFGRYLMQLATFDLGYSYRNAAPVMDVLMTRLPTTLLLMALSVVVSVAIGTLMGVAAARNAGKWPDSVLSIVALVFYATPVFIVAVILILVFGVWLNWLPFSGIRTIASRATGFAAFWDVTRHLILPVLALSTFYVAIYLRLARSSLLEVMHLDFVRTAKAKGLSPRRVLYRHALGNALLPIVTMAGLQVSSLMGGAVLTETVFSLPGLGRTAYDAIFNRDVSMLLGVMFICSFAVVCVNLVVDIFYVLLDPRVDL